MNKKAELIKSSLLKKGYSLTMIAKELNISNTVISYVISGKQRNSRVESKIKELTGITFPPLKRLPREDLYKKVDQGAHND